MQTHLRIPESGQLSGKNLYPNLPANRGGLVGLAIDGLPIWSPLYQHGQNDTCCDAGVISSTLADNCNRLMGAGYIKPPHCLASECIDEMMSEDGVCVTSVTVGVALDGFPIKVGASNNTLSMLDECGGTVDNEGFRSK